MPEKTSLVDVARWALRTLPASLEGQSPILELGASMIVPALQEALEAWVDSDPLRAECYLESFLDRGIEFAVALRSGTLPDGLAALVAGSEPIPATVADDQVRGPDLRDGSDPVG